MRLPHLLIMFVGQAWLPAGAAVTPDDEHDAYAWWPATSTTGPPRRTSRSRMVACWREPRLPHAQAPVVHALDDLRDLLAVWLVPGLHALEFVFGLAHGLGWIVMCVLSLAAVRARVISLRLGIAVAVIGAVGPFVGSYEFVREERRRAARPALNTSTGIGGMGRSGKGEASIRAY